jgi:cyclohexanecarboxylate-CoA ligase
MATAPTTTQRILDDLERWTTRDADGRAAVCVDAAGEDHVLTWGRLSADAERLARRLRALGVGPGDPVAYQLPNRTEFLIITLAVLRLGATCMPLMPMFRERELSFMLAEARARVLIVPRTDRGTDHAALAAAVAMQLPLLAHVIVLDGDDDLFADTPPVAPAGEPPLDAPPADHVAQLLFTSGSTGDPKGVLMRQHVLVRAADAHIAHFELGPEDVIYIPSPYAHQTGFLYGMTIALRLGVTQVATEHWDGELGMAAIERHGVTFTQAATPFLADLTRIASERGAAPATLRRFVATGAAIPRALAHAARAQLDAEVGGGFGTTESCMGAGFVPGLPDERAWTTDGRALANVILRVVDDHGTVLPPGVEGNFEILTDTLFDGYLNRPQATAEAFSPDGWYRPGDLATIDADGYLRITGRVKDVVNRGGEKIPVGDVEQLLYAHPAVAEVAIVAMPDPRLGERACAFVVLAGGRGSDSPGLTFAQMQEHLAAAELAKPYWPERLELVSELPRTPSGKIQKFVLRDRAKDLTVQREVTAR